MVYIMHDMYHALFSHWNLMDQKVVFHRFCSQKKKNYLKLFFLLLGMIQLGFPVSLGKLVAWVQNFMFMTPPMLVGVVCVTQLQQHKFKQS